MYLLKIQKTRLLEEKKNYQGNPFKKNPSLVDRAFDKLEGLIKVKKIGKEVKKIDEDWQKTNRQDKTDGCLLYTSDAADDP